MISMNTKHWQANIEVRIFIIHMTKSVITNMLYTQAKQVLMQNELG